MELKLGKRRAVLFLNFVANLATDAELQANPKAEDWTGDLDSLIVQARAIQKLIREENENAL